MILVTRPICQGLRTSPRYEWLQQFSQITTAPCCFFPFAFYTAATGFIKLQDVESNPPECWEIFSTIVILGLAGIFRESNIQNPVQIMVSRPAEPPRQTLAELYVNLSAYTAPIRQTHLPFLLANGRINGDNASQSLPETSLLLSCDDARACISALPISPVLYSGVWTLHIMPIGSIFHSMPANRIAWDSTNQIIVQCSNLSAFW